MSPFHHEALLYAGQDEFLAGTLPFARAGLADGEPVLAVLAPAKIDLLREALGADAAHVRFADMGRIGANPARIIPAWQDFVRAHMRDGRGARGIGEPIGPERRGAELAECHRHEALLNVAFAGATGFRLLCPYDTAVLDDDVIDEARHNHPVVVHDGVARESARYGGACAADARAASEPLPEPPATADELAFHANSLVEVRRFALGRARAAGMRERRARDFVVAVNEIATNSVRYGGGHGVLRIWRADGALVCDIRDGGRIEHPLAGRERPAPGQLGGYGLWLANQLCDLVQVRALPHGGVVRLYERL